MKKAVLFLLLLLTTAQAVRAQIDWGAYSQSFPDGALDDPATVAIIAAVPKPNDSFWIITANPTEAYYKFSDDPSSQQVPMEHIIARNSFDSAPVHFFLHGVNPQNASGYQFRVREYPDARVLVPWKNADRFTDSSLVKSSGLPAMTYLGGYKAPLGHTIIVEVRQTNPQRIIGVSVIRWVSIKPNITNVYTSDNLDAFLKKLQHPWASQSDPAHESRPSGLLKLPAPHNNLILYLGADIIDKEQLQYELRKNGRVMIPWKNNDFENSFIWLKDNEPGVYQLHIRYAVQPQHVTDYDFEVEPAWYQSLSFKIMLGIFLAACFGAVYFMLLFIRQKQKASRELAKKTRLQLELKTIYAQLNPHFVFNALSSIQGLINQQDIQGANRYLADFARLMRESLTNSSREEISLHEEVQGLETYLKLERLRFGFTYQISLDDAIQPYESSIPALLLQPLVENAVKHGASALGKAGQVDIRFEKRDEMMIVRISDNGKGYPDEASTGGFGLKLTRDRIELMNQLNPVQPIQLEITARSPAGTEVILRFNHWFA
ncbi:sensor histidine kinase [Salmonirosea aquatica]|uniref:Histidine kinase n=1 Tax=Salmonirosea aquatica TaxID=2654236 RepID=A0A7C9F642_9BACT|nr:histidine kinase [Cytophagaceae bacterium SJW1-29]